MAVGLAHKKYTTELAKVNGFVVSEVSVSTGFFHTEVMLTLSKMEVDIHLSGETHGNADECVHKIIDEYILYRQGTLSVHEDDDDEIYFYD